MRLATVCLFVAWLADAELKTTKASGTSSPTCAFKDQTFSAGDSWHPYLEPFGLMLCMRCMCAEVRLLLLCTTVCWVLVVSADEPRVPAGLRASVKTCRYNGSVYQPGETFTKQDLFPSRQNNQCVMYHVTSSSSSPDDGNQQLNRGVESVPAGGATSTSLKSSPRTGGLRTGDLRTGGPRTGGLRTGGLRTRGLRMVDPRTGPWHLSLSKLNLQGAADTTVKIFLQKKQQKACSYNSKTYSHGETWHPVLGRVLECILCSCSDGLQECRRITCPNQYPCKRPTKSAGKCCKICPEDLQLMEIAEVERKDVTDHPESYTLLTTVDEDTWKKFRGENVGEISQTTICDDGVREIVHYLNPKHTEDLCSP
ncbi:hypothetical protein CRUP_022281 [Coryphaenoides rupestris]|nr:hypothetical protein CRUP_022281 [Coryphaenoides rupestris]